MGFKDWTRLNKIEQDWAKLSKILEWSWNGMRRNLKIEQDWTRFWGGVGMRWGVIIGVFFYVMCLFPRAYSVGQAQFRLHRNAKGTHTKNTKLKRCSINFRLRNWFNITPHPSWNFAPLWALVANLQSTYQKPHNTDFATFVCIYFVFFVGNKHILQTHPTNNLHSKCTFIFHSSTYKFSKT
jgi:hypothetical protein